MIRRRVDFEVGTRIAQEMYQGAARAERPAAPRTINLDTIDVLVAGKSFRYKGKQYHVPRLAWFDGLLLEYLLNCITDAFQSRRVTVDHLIELRDYFDDVFALMWKNTEHRWWQRNPFRQATLQETIDLSRFFSECQMQRPDLSLDLSPAIRRQPGPRTTSRIRSRSLRRRLAPSGWTHRGFLEAMFTSR